MYGTVARLRPKPGHEQGVIEYVEYWVRERKPTTPGALGGYVYRLDNDPGAWLFAVVFQDLESYRANAESTAMDADYHRLRALLLESPVWEDGEIVAQF
jgi:quinol monooxygenase YgiN